MVDCLQLLILCFYNRLITIPCGPSPSCRAGARLTRVHAQNYFPNLIKSNQYQFVFTKNYFQILRNFGKYFEKGRSTDPEIRNPSQNSSSSLQKRNFSRYENRIERFRHVNSLLMFHSTKILKITLLCYLRKSWKNDFWLTSKICREISYPNGFLDSCRGRNRFRFSCRGCNKTSAFVFFQLIAAPPTMGNHHLRLPTQTT